MKIHLSSSKARRQGWALLVVLSLAATTLMVLAAVMAWTNENSAVVARNNEYFSTTYAAEAATEKAMGAIVEDFQNYGSIAATGTSAYTALYPTSSDNSYWTNYQFSGGATANTVIVSNVNTAVTLVLGPPYTSLKANGQTYDIIANAQKKSSMYGIVSTVGQQINLTQIPIFQFAIFYQDTMEVDPGATMTVTGLVHGNNNIFADPNSGITLTFASDVSSSGTINLSENPLDPTTSRPANPLVDFGGNHTSDVNQLNLPVGTNASAVSTNIASSVDGILQMPGPGVTASSSVGTNLLYNKADMIIVISNDNSITVSSGVAINNQATVLSNNQWSTFVNTNTPFYDQRDGAEVEAVNINVGALAQWNATNTGPGTLNYALANAPGRESLAAPGAVSSIYVADLRYLTNAIVTTSYTTVTNYALTNTTAYPAAGTYAPPVATNTIVINTPSYPAANQYLGVVATNTTPATSSSYPAGGTYLGSVTINSGNPRYSYNKITSYTYNGISSYTYNGAAGTTTTTNYSTNYVEIGQPGIVLTNGAELPPNGLSVVTPDPAYIDGNWNVTTNGTTMSTQSYNTANTYPSAIYADAITILSPSWNPANSANSILSRVANSGGDTVNAAILTGNVPSNQTYYSGGVENFVRFLENWSGDNFYYSGSMVEMFTSQIANAPWPGTGVVYNPPNRDWAFDTNFNNPKELPPLTPQVIYINRAQWTNLPPRTAIF
jgi:hypothetical protein